MLDPVERWLVEASTGPRSKIGPWLVIGLLLMLAVVMRARKKAKEEQAEEADG